MPDRRLLRPGDRIRLLQVPESDLKQRERELLDDSLDDPGWTADTIERILAANPVVTISRIDEFGIPWFEYVFSDQDVHSIAILEDTSWELAGAPG